MSLTTFRPRLVTALVGYNRARLLGDLGAGMTVAIVALPLAMAFAIASGLKPEAGLFTAIIAGLLISLLGGSRVQIGGPAGAFIVIVYGIVHDHGVAGLLVATVLSGVLLLAMGLLRIGSLIRFIPMSVVIGFTNGIAVLIALSQVKDLFGLVVPDMPGDFFGILTALWTHRATFNPWAPLLALASLGILAAWRPALAATVRRHTAWARWISLLQAMPATILALIAATAAVAAFGLPVETIGSRFGGIPSGLPHFSPPVLEWESARLLLMPAITLALLGAIESLLCARVADGLIADRHDPNQELMAQGVANIAAPLFGGMPATGTIARTVTNVNAGATSPVAGVFHAIVLLAVVLLAAPLAASIPLAALAAILLHVAWNMGQWREFARLRRFPLPYRFTLLSVFLLTVVFDLTVAVQFGILASVVTFIYRIASLTGARPLAPPEFEGKTHRVQAWQLQGAIFFGSTGVADTLADRLPTQVLLLDFSRLIYMDTTGADSLLQLATTCRRRGVRLFTTGLEGQPLDMARRSGLHDQLAPGMAPDLAQAVKLALLVLLDDQPPGAGKG